MTKREDIEKRTEELIRPILDRLSLSLYDVEYVKEGSDWFLRVYIEKEGGVTVKDCEDVSREMNEKLDLLDYVDGSYIFEVSSPGLTRKLTKDVHFEKSLGKKVELKTFRPKEDRKSFEGILTDYSDGELTIREEDGKELTFQRNEISVIRLAFVDD